VTNRRVRSPSCTRYQTLTGSRLIKGASGVNRVKVTNRFRSRALRAGKYRVVLRATKGNTRLVNVTVRSR